MKISQDVIVILEQSTVTPQSLVLPEGKLDRQLYTAVNKVLETIGGKWDRKSASHLFSKGNAADLLNEILLTGEVTDAKKDFGAFFTPEVVVAQAIDMADISENHVVLEPSAGHGNIALLLARVAKEVQCYEILPAHVEFLKELAPDNMVVHDPVDFMTVEPTPIYDRIVMNPPFAFKADIRHILHALKFLKPGGVLVSIASAGVKFRTDRETVAFRELVSANGEIYSLPEGSFKESGTMVQTVIVKIRN